jgi:hypothetical protein
MPCPVAGSGNDVKRPVNRELVVKYRVITNYVSDSYQ